MKLLLRLSRTYLNYLLALNLEAVVAAAVAAAEVVVAEVAVVEVFPLRLHIHHLTIQLELKMIKRIYQKTFFGLGTKPTPKTSPHLEAHNCNNKNVL